MLNTLGKSLNAFKWLHFSSFDRCVRKRETKWQGQMDRWTETERHTVTDTERGTETEKERNPGIHGREKRR